MWRPGTASAPPQPRVGWAEPRHVAAAASRRGHPFFWVHPYFFRGPKVPSSSPESWSRPETEGVGGAVVPGHGRWGAASGCTGSPQATMQKNEWNFLKSRGARGEPGSPLLPGRANPLSKAFYYFFFFFKKKKLLKLQRTRPSPELGGLSPCWCFLSARYPCTRLY